MEGGVKWLAERVDCRHPGAFEDTSEFSLDVQHALSPGCIDQLVWCRGDGSLKVIKHRRHLRENTARRMLTHLLAFLIDAPPVICKLGHRALELIEKVVPLGNQRVDVEFLELGFVGFRFDSINLPVHHGFFVFVDH